MNSKSKFLYIIIFIFLLNTSTINLYHTHGKGIILEEEQESVEREKNNKIEKVFKEKDLLKDFKQANEEKEFRLFIKPKNFDSRTFLQSIGKNIQKISIVDGLFATFTKAELVYLIEKGLIHSAWNNSVIEIADSSENITTSLEQGIANFTNMINAPTLWEKNIKGENTTIAILDTGIMKNHPALNTKQNGNLRILSTKNFFDPASYPTDDNGHGTAIAGIIGSNGLFGYPVGIAPNCNFIIGKILSNRGDGTLETLLQGIDWAIEHKVDIINLSLGKKVESLEAPEVEAVNNAVEKGIIVVTAVGNYRGRINFGYNSKYTVLSPGIASKAITVGAVDSNDVLYEYSSGGPININYNETTSRDLFDFDDVNYLVKPDLVAPGVRINTTTNSLSSTRIVTGTSYSTAVVSGACSLLLSISKEYKPSMIKSVLLSSAKKIENNIVTPTNNIVKVSPEIFYQGAGLVDLAEAENRLKDYPEFNIWPSDVSFINKRMFINEKQQFVISLFVNKPLNSFEIQVSEEISEGITIENFNDINEGKIGQYELNFIINAERISSGLHKEEISFVSPELEINLSLQLHIVNAKGKVLIDYFESGFYDFYSLKGSLSNFMYSLRKMQYIPDFIRRDIDHTKLSDLNLLDYDLIVLINPNGTTELREYYSEEELKELRDYLLPDGKYNGGSLLILPSELSDFNFIANLTEPFGISLTQTEIEGEFFQYSFPVGALFSYPYDINEFYIPHPIIVSGGNSSVKNYENRFVYADYRDKGGSLIFVANDIEMFLSSPYYYSGIQDEYILTRYSSRFGNNSKLLENILYACSPNYMWLTTEIPKKEFLKDENITLKLTLENRNKYISGWSFTLTIENEKMILYPSVQITDFKNGSYTLSLNLEENGIKPGKYSLFVRSFAGNEKIEINVITNFSMSPRYVEIPLIVSIVLVIVLERRKKIKK